MFVRTCNNFTLSLRPIKGSRLLRNLLVARDGGLVTQKTWQHGMLRTGPGDVTPLSVGRRYFKATPHGSQSTICTILNNFYKFMGIMWVNMFCGSFCRKRLFTASTLVQMFAVLMLKRREFQILKHTFILVPCLHFCRGISFIEMFVPPYSRPP